MRLLWGFAFLFWAISLAQSKQIYVICGSPKDEYIKGSPHSYSTPCIVRNLNVNSLDEVNFLDREKEEHFHGSKLDIDIFNWAKNYYYSLSNIQNIRFENCSIAEVPNKMFDKFHKLSAVNMSNVKLRNLTFLNHFETRSLEKLDLSHNEIDKIQNETFQNLNSLEYLNLTYNKISSIDKESFKNLNQIKELSLQHNELQRLDNDLFENWQSPTSIDLSDNHLQKFDCKILQPIDNYELTLNLSGNHYLVFDENCFDFENFSKRKYEGVLFPYQRLHAITVLLDFQRLDLSNTPVLEASIADDVKFWTTELWIRSIETNQLTPFLSHFRNLFLLDLSNSRFGQLNISTLATQRELSTLILRNCSLETITYGTFANQNSLDSLDLSYNNFREIDFKVFYPSLSSISKINLNSNNLWNVVGVSGEMFPHLRKLGLSENHFKCSYIVEIFRQLRKSYTKSNNHLLNVAHVDGNICDND